MNRTLEQKRAKAALDFIRSIADKGESNKKFRAKLYTHIQKAPVQILQNGLGQMLAFLLSDNGQAIGEQRKPSGVLYDHLAGWLCGAKKNEFPCRVYTSEEGNLIEQLVAGERKQYIMAQRESLALFAWLKKFADAWLDEGGG